MATPKQSWVTEIANDIYCKGINTNAFSSTLNNIVAYLKKKKNYIFNITSSNPVFLGSLLNTQNMQETNLSLTF